MARHDDEVFHGGQLLHLGDFGHSDADRFFDQHRLAGLQCEPRIFEMRLEIGQDKYRVNRRVGDQFFGCFVVLASEFGRALFRSILRPVPEANEFGAMALLNGLGMQNGNVAGADEADADRIFLENHLELSGRVGA